MTLAKLYVVTANQSVKFESLICPYTARYDFSDSNR